MWRSQLAYRAVTAAGSVLLKGGYIKATAEPKVEHMRAFLKKEAQNSNRKHVPKIDPNFRENRG